MPTWIAYEKKHRKMLETLEIQIEQDRVQIFARLYEALASSKYRCLHNKRRTKVRLFIFANCQGSLIELRKKKTCVWHWHMLYFVKDEHSFTSYAEVLNMSLIIYYSDTYFQCAPFPDMTTMYVIIKVLLYTQVERSAFEVQPHQTSSVLVIYRWASYAPIGRILSRYIELLQYGHTMRWI